MDHWKLDTVKKLRVARTTLQIEEALSELPVVDPNDYSLDFDGKPMGTWKSGYLHWLPVGRERGNGGRIKLAGEPVNPLAERLVNGMEAIIELERLRELQKDDSAEMPANPRDAVVRYFGLPRLDLIPRMEPDEIRKHRQAVDAVRKKLMVMLQYEKKSREFAITIRDHGMGQMPSRMHETLLSLGQSDKADKPYLIGVFGQGGSSAFAASEYSVIMSRRSPDLTSSTQDRGLGWSVVRQVFPKKYSRASYFAYLAATEEGAVPFVSGEAADKLGFDHGSQFGHVKYDFGSSESAVTRLMYQALNHVLFSPVLPYELYAMKEKPELMQGTGQRLARQAAKIGRSGGAIDKSFASQAVA
jgi:hypothetical protein